MSSDSSDDETDESGSTGKAPVDDSDSGKQEVKLRSKLSDPLKTEFDKANNIFSKNAEMLSKNK